MPSEHNSRVTKYQKEFTEQYQNRTLLSVQSLTNAQKYILRELRLLGNTSQDTATISMLDQAFRLPLTEVIKREINRLHRGKVTGNELLEELAIIYHRYNMVDIEKERHQTDEQSETIAKIICSAAMI